jgi:Tol biopolymer transport system component
VEALYNEMRARPPDERASALAAACPDDPTLAAEVLSLLDQPDSAAPFLNSPALEVAARLASGASSSFTGRRIGVFEVQGLLGAGGMGEVYRARDTRLGRSVAIKILPRAFKDDPERMVRFEREARVLASLNHPRICALYDVGRDQDTDYLVMELVEGETLAARLKKGALPFEQALRIAIEIADALDKAHRQGVIHRDLKPGNVMLTKSGAKLMDFGLAKLTLLGKDAEGISALPTASEPLTGEGTLMGTVPYMAPEQLEGETPDARSDLWALGCVLYEMATGRPAFEGRSRASLISSIMAAAPPPIGQIQPLTPPSLERLVKVCLAKDPDDRLQTAHDVMQELKWIAEAPAGTSGVTASGPGFPSPGRRRWALAVGGLILLSAAILGGLVGQRLPQDRGPGSHDAERKATFTDIAPPPGMHLSAIPTDSRLSDDGRQFVFLPVDNQDGRRLWLRDLDTGASRPLPGTENAGPVSWSRDGRRIVFAAEGDLKLLDIATGAVKNLTRLPRGGGDVGDLTGTWNQAGDFVFSWWGLHHIPASGGEPKVAILPDAARGEAFFEVPQFLPDGRHYLFSAVGLTPEQSGVYIGTLASSERRLILPSIEWAVFAPQGYLLFRRGSALFAQRFDPGRRELSGEPEPLVDGLLTPTWRGPNAWVGGDSLVYARGAAPRSRLTWFDRTGRESGPVGEFEDIITFDLSPDGTRVVAMIGFPGSSVWLIDASRGTSKRLTQGVGDGDPHFSGDAQSVLFVSGLPGRSGLFRLSLSGGGQTEVFRERPNTTPGSLPVSRLVATGWSHDGRIVLYSQNEELWSAPVSGDGEPKLVLRGPSISGGAHFAPDGRWVAYHHGVETGRSEVFVIPFPPTGERWQVSIAGGVQPTWRGDGRELFFLDPDGNLMSVEVSATRTIASGPPRVLFRTGVARPNAVIPDYGVTADGQRFLIKLPAAGNVPPELKLILDWTALLGKQKQTRPAGGPPA